MNLLGNKVQARAVARKLGIPVVPGSDGAVDIATARQLISEIGLPIMLKAEGGGGGRGIFAIHNEAELEDAFFKASTMAQASSAIRACSWKNSWPMCATSRSRSSPTSTATCSPLTNVTAPCSATTRSSSRSRPRPGRA